MTFFFVFIGGIALILWVIALMDWFARRKRSTGGASRAIDLRWWMPRLQAARRGYYSRRGGKARAAADFPPGETGRRARAGQRRRAAASMTSSSAGPLRGTRPTHAGGRL